MNKKSPPNIIQQFLQIFGNPQVATEEKPAAEKKKNITKCPGCKCSLEEVYEDGKLQCLQCYPTFGDEILSVLEGTKKTDKKKKKKKPNKNYMELLKADMELAIAKEDYERAALIRDAIAQVTAIDIEKDKLKQLLDKALVEENYEEASLLKKQIDTKIQECSTIQRRLES